MNSKKQDILSAMTRTSSLRKLKHQLLNLIEAKVDVNLGNGAITPLIWAIEELKDEDIVLSLLEARADPNASDYLDDTPLLLSKNKKVTLELLRSKADPHHIGHKSKSCLHHQTDPTVVKELLRLGAPFNSLDRYKQTPLRYQTHPKSIKCLLREGAKLSRSSDEITSDNFVHTLYKELILEELLKRVVSPSQSSHHIFPFPSEGGHISLFKDVVDYASDVDDVYLAP